jgi:hypothetical protein
LLFRTTNFLPRSTHSYIVILSYPVDDEILKDSFTAMKELLTPMETSVTTAEQAQWYDLLLYMGIGPAESISTGSPRSADLHRERSGTGNMAPTQPLDGFIVVIATM